MESRQAAEEFCEDGVVHNPVFRFVSRFVFGHTATLEAYAAALEAELAGSAAYG